MRKYAFQHLDIFISTFDHTYWALPGISRQPSNTNVRLQEARLFLFITYSSAWRDTLPNYALFLVSTLHLTKSYSCRGFINSSDAYDSVGVSKLHNTHKHWATCTSLSSSSFTSYVSIDLFPPRLIVSEKVFQVVFVHSVYNSALFLPSRCCSFLLHVGASWICTFLVSSSTGSAFQLFQNFFILFVLIKNVPGCSSENLHLDWCQTLFALFFLRVQISLPNQRKGWASVLYTFTLENV